MHDIKNSAFPVALQLDESTNVACIIQLLVFVRYVQKEKIKVELKEEYLFCESLETIAAATDVMNLIKDFFAKHDIPLEKILVCAYRWFTGYGYKSGFVALLKNMNLNLIHCILHRYALISKTLPDNLKEVKGSVVHIVNLIQGRATDHRLFN